MEEVLARLKVFDRTLLISRPMAYLGRSGSDFDGSFSTYLKDNEIEENSFV